MTTFEVLPSSLASIGIILVAMAAIAAVDAAIPLHRRDRWNALHTRPNLALTAITFATSLAFNAALVTALARLERIGFGLVPRITSGALPAVLLVVVGLDLTFYAAHRLMHGVPALWRYHRVHHSDPAVDVTTTIRQHPGETVFRYASMAVGAVVLGASPGAFAVYRLWSALAGLVEHANLRLPPVVDDLLALVVSTPNFHKVHHSRAPEHHDTNFGNCFSLFARWFGTCTPARRGTTVRCGVDGLDDAALQTTAGLLAMPWHVGAGASAPVTAPARSERWPACARRGSS